MKKVIKNLHMSYIYITFVIEKETDYVCRI